MREQARDATNQDGWNVEYLDTDGWKVWTHFFPATLDQATKIATNLNKIYAGLVEWRAYPNLKEKQK